MAQAAVAPEQPRVCLRGRCARGAGARNQGAARLAAAAARPGAHRAALRGTGTSASWCRPSSAAIVPTGHEVFITAACELDEQQFQRAVERSASFIVATNVLDGAQLSDEELIAVYKGQHSVERGFAFLKDPLFLASSVFVKKWLCRLRHLIG